MGELLRIIIAIIRNLYENDLWGTIVIAIFIVGYYFLSRLLIRKIFHKKVIGKTDDITNTVSSKSIGEKAADNYNDPVKQYEETKNSLYYFIEFAIVLILFFYIASTLGLIKTDFYEISKSVGLSKP
jgi:hypothetical protein